ncbi:uncharacterized protein LOC130743382 [Lotus japonicus]|uniref:uncharacterized protein LOC130743382 n=1 Tax=Lotus japonicus TaxID=34305 RepID=UPI002583EDBF|nr:uncharacterized protein LOC130743382 [Lotus japonicus]
MSQMAPRSESSSPRRLYDFAKSALIKIFSHPYATVCELYCGGGVDADKWVDAQIAHYIGIDVSSSGIRQIREAWESTRNSYTTDFFELDPCMENMEPHLGEKKNSADFVCCMNHLQMCFETEEKAGKLLHNVSSLLKPGGYFIGIVPDSSTIWAKYQKNVEACHNRSSSMKPNIVPNCIRTENYMITFEVEEEKFPFFGKKYQLKFANDVSTETHCLVHFPSFIRLGRAAGLEYVEIQNLTDFYDDNRALLAGLLSNHVPNLLDPRGRLLPRSYDALGLYSTFIFQKPDPDVEPPCTPWKVRNVMYNDESSYPQGICELKENIMEGDASCTMDQPPFFDGEEYELWAARMTTHLEALDLWEAVEENYDVPELTTIPTMAQNHKEKKTKNAKARYCLFTAVSGIILTRIMSLRSAKDIWDYLKAEYQGSESTRDMQVLNLAREFEMQSIKENETIRDYADRLLSIANKMRLLGKDFPDERIVQKILVTIPEKYELKISGLKESKHLSAIITLGELINAVEAQEHGRMMRQEEGVQGDIFPSCPYCKKTNHPQTKCFWRPNVECINCGNMGHVDRVCKSEPKVAMVTMEEQEDGLFFVTTCFATSNISSNSWLIDSGCTNHMTNDEKLFIELDKSIVSKVKVGNGDFISVKGKGTVVIESLTGLKYIPDVLYVPDIDQNLLSVAQLVEKGFKVIFEDNTCVIKDAKGSDIFKVKMKAKCYALNLAEREFPILSMEDGKPGLSSAIIVADDPIAMSPTLNHVNGLNPAVGSDDVVEPTIHAMISDDNHTTSISTMMRTSRSKSLSMQNNISAVVNC